LGHEVERKRVKKKKKKGRMKGKGKGTVLAFLVAWSDMVVVWEGRVGLKRKKRRRECEKKKKKKEEKKKSKKKKKEKKRKRKKKGKSNIFSALLPFLLIEQRRSPQALLYWFVIHFSIEF